MRVLLVGGTKVSKLVAVAAERFKATIEIDGIEFISGIDDYFDKGGTFDRVIVAGPGYADESLSEVELRKNIDNFIRSVRDRLKRFSMVIVTENEEYGAQLVEATLDITGNAAIVFLNKAKGEKFSSSFLNNLIITDLTNFNSKFKVLDISFLQDLDKQTSDGIIDETEIDWSTPKEVEQAEYTVPKAKEIDVEGLEDEEELDDETPVGVQDDFGISGGFEGLEEASWDSDIESLENQEEEESVGDDFDDIDFGFNSGQESEDDTEESEQNSEEDDEAGFGGIFAEEDESDGFEGIFAEEDESEHLVDSETEDLSIDDTFDEFNTAESEKEFVRSDIEETSTSDFNISSSFDSDIENIHETNSFEETLIGEDEDLDKLFQDAEDTENDSFNSNDDIDKLFEEDTTDNEVEEPEEIKAPPIVVEKPKKSRLIPPIINKKQSNIDDSTNKKLKLRNNKIEALDVESMYMDNTDDKSNISGTELNLARNINGIKGAGIKKRTNKKQPMNQQMSSYDILKLKLDGYKKRGNLLVVTGSHNTGKTTVAANLANLVCKLGYQVLIVDMDTRGRGMSYINIDSYEAVHSQRTDDSTLRLALNNSGDKFGRYVSIVRPGMHLLSTGLAYDSQDAKDTISRTNLTKFIHQAQNLYQLIIVDMEFADATENFTEFTLAADEIVLVSEVNTHGLMELLLNLSNISDNSENVSDVLFENSKLLLNKEDGMTKLFGKKVMNTGQVLSVLDDKLTELIGFSIDRRLSDLEVCGLLKYNASFEEYWYNRAYLSDTQDGEAIFLEILQRILDIK